MADCTALADSTLLQMTLIIGPQAKTWPQYSLLHVFLFFCLWLKHLTDDYEIWCSQLSASELCCGFKPIDIYSFAIPLPIVASYGGRCENTVWCCCSNIVMCIRRCKSSVKPTASHDVLQTSADIFSVSSLAVRPAILHRWTAAKHCHIRRRSFWLSWNYVFCSRRIWSIRWRQWITHVWLVIIANRAQYRLKGKMVKVVPSQVRYKCSWSHFLCR